jgi:hypothetical protein
MNYNCYNNFTALPDFKMNQTIKDGFKYFTYFMIFFAGFLVFVLLLVVFIEDGPDEEAKERHKWCKEHHPSLTMEECSNEAGW